MEYEIQKQCLKISKKKQCYPIDNEMYTQANKNDKNKNNRKPLNTILLCCSLSGEN